MQNVSKMFHSATLKLTAWYLVGVMLLSIVFSVVVYNFAGSELAARFDAVESRLSKNTTLLDEEGGFNFTILRTRQISAAKQNIIGLLVYANLTVLVIASVTSYLWARRTLKPIEATHEAQTQFVSDASHELKTPLAVMKTEIEVILHDSKSTKQDYKEILESTLEEVDRLSDLSAMLLKLAKLDYKTLEWRTFNITDTLDIAIKSLGDKAERVDISPVKKLPDITANPASVTELAVILLDNALKYSPPKSRVSVALKRRQKTIELTVTNKGKGIASEQLPHIFTRFYRADSSRSKQATAGHGLGLPLAKKIVELHHGELSASSKPGDFTSFTVRLPLSQN